MHSSYVHKILVSYDGTLFYGWQKTAAGPSIQGSLEKALHTITGEVIPVEGCSRTDRGVHALGQVASFSTLLPITCYKKFQKSLNSLLPKEIHVRHLEEASSEFHPGLDALSKEYTYYICTSPQQLPEHRLYSWHVAYPLDLSLMQEAASLLKGCQDFESFTNKRADKKYTSTVRHLETFKIENLPGERLQIKLIGNHFLYKMARNLVGTVIYIGRGKIALEDLSSILQKKERLKAGITAPACGLWLTNIIYDTKK